MKLFSVETSFERRMLFVEAHTSWVERLAQGSIAPALRDSFLAAQQVSSFHARLWSSMNTGEMSVVVSFMPATLFSSRTRIDMESRM